MLTFPKLVARRTDGDADAVERTWNLRDGHGASHDAASGPKDDGTVQEVLFQSEEVRERREAACDGAGRCQFGQHVGGSDQ